MKFPIIFNQKYHCAKHSCDISYEISCDVVVGNSWECHYTDVMMGEMASQITSLKIVYSSIYWGADQRKHQSSASLAFVRGIHRGPVNSLHKGPVARKMFPLDDVIMHWQLRRNYLNHIWVISNGVIWLLVHSNVIRNTRNKLLMNNKSIADMFQSWKSHGPVTSTLFAFPSVL